MPGTVRNASRPPRMSVPEAVAFGAWCFAVALAGGLVGLVLGNIRLPAVLLLAASPGSAGGANIAISGVTAATASVAHIRAGRVNWRLFAWMAPPSVAGALVGGLPRRRRAGRCGAPGDRRGARLQRHRPAQHALRRAAARTDGEPGTNVAAVVLSGAVIGLLGGFVGLILGTLRIPALLRFTGEPAEPDGRDEPARRRARRRGRLARPPSERGARPRHRPRRLGGLDPGRAPRRTAHRAALGGAAPERDRRRPARRRSRPPASRRWSDLA